MASLRYCPLREVRSVDLEMKVTDCDTVDLSDCNVGFTKDGLGSLRSERNRPKIDWRRTIEWQVDWRTETVQRTLRISDVQS